MSVRFVRPQRDDALQLGVEPDVGFLIVSHPIQVVGRWVVVGLGSRCFLRFAIVVSPVRGIWSER